MVDLVDPIDRALRSTRVLVRRTAVTAYRHRPVPASYARLCNDLADAAAVVARELMADRMAVAARPVLVAVGDATGQVERTADLNTDVILAQIRSVVADLLLLTGLDELEATDLLPPPPDRTHESPDDPLGAPRRPRHVPGGGGDPAQARAGRQARGGRRARHRQRASGRLDGVLRSPRVRHPLRHAAAHRLQEVPRRGLPARRRTPLPGGVGGGDGSDPRAGVGRRTRGARGARLGRGVPRRG